MFSVWVTVQVKPQKRDEFRDAIAINARRSVSEEPGCLYFDVVEFEGAEHCFGFYEIYRDADAFYKEHRSAPHYADWKLAVEETVVTGSQVMTVGERIIATDADHGATPSVVSLEDGL
ncbi:putative quinol monooxygenase [Cryobacterium sp. Y62]|uniref:putative quinol monooxygenase n=1 Tax=Cryobacterium sp. Y62 TaxID=2048284 RepID=UPI000CE44FBE|nr:putative quinol monooxygenase [Cryobacterium sp. Y62]